MFGTTKRTIDGSAGEAGRPAGREGGRDDLAAFGLLPIERADHASPLFARDVRVGVGPVIAPGDPVEDRPCLM